MKTFVDEVNNLRQKVSSENIKKFDDFIQSYINPIHSLGNIFTSDVNLKPNNDFVLGGRGNIKAIGDLILLGGAKCGDLINVTVNGEASVDIEMWFLYGQMAAGAWTISGPGSKQIVLNCNTTNNVCPPNWIGQECYVKAKGLSGKFPVAVNF